MTSGKKLQNLSLILGLVGGLLILLGAVVVGLWMSQGNASGDPASVVPWKLKPQQQMQLITLLARDYSQSKDISRAKEALNGWDADNLSELFATLELQTTDVEVLRQLIALREALGLHVSLFTTASLLRQDTIIWGAALALLLLLGAGIVAVWPNRQPEPTEVGDVQQDAALPEDEGVDEIAVQDGGASATAAAGNPEEASPQEEQNNQAAGSPAKESDSLEQLVAQGPGEVQDIFSSLFEEEDTDSEDLSLLVQGLEDIDMTDLAGKAQEILDRLYDLSRRR